MEITPVRGFFIIIALISATLQYFGVFGFVAQSMHEQAMQFNDVYTSTDEDDKNRAKKIEWRILCRWDLYVCVFGVARDEAGRIYDFVYVVQVNN